MRRFLLLDKNGDAIAPPGSLEFRGNPCLKANWRLLCKDPFFIEEIHGFISRMFTNRLVSRENTSDVFFKVRLPKGAFRSPKRKKEAVGSYLRKFIRDLSHIALLECARRHAFKDFGMRIITSGFWGYNKFAEAPCFAYAHGILLGDVLSSTFFIFAVRTSSLFFSLSLSFSSSSSSRGPPQTRNLPV